MDGSDTKELIQKRISDFVGYLMTNHSLSKAAVVTGMEAYIALNKSRNKDVEVEECFGNLAWTTSCLSDSKNLSSSVLFFVLDPSMNLNEDSAEKIGLRCIICNTVICMDAMRDGNGYCISTEVQHRFCPLHSSYHYTYSTPILPRPPTYAGNS